MSLPFKRIGYFSYTNSRQNPLLSMLYYRIPPVGFFALHCWALASLEWQIAIDDCQIVILNLILKHQTRKEIDRWKSWILPGCIFRFTRSRDPRASPVEQHTLLLVFNSWRKTDEERQLWTLGFALITLWHLNTLIVIMILMLMEDRWTSIFYFRVFDFKDHLVYSICHMNEALH